MVPDLIVSVDTEYVRRREAEDWGGLPEGTRRRNAVLCYSVAVYVPSTLQLPTSLTSRRGRCSYGFVLCLSPIRSLEVEAFKGLDAEGLALRGKPPRH